jgi:hypothetical protein
MIIIVKIIHGIAGNIVRINHVATILANAIGG